MELKPSFVQQLANLESRLTKLGFGPITSGWTDKNDFYQQSPDDILLRNTYLNAQVGEFMDYENPTIEEKYDRIT